MLKEKYSEIIGFFELDSEEKKAAFSEILAKSLQFSEEMKDKMLHGTDEERNEVEEILAEMRGKISEETSKICSEIGISEEELPSYLANPNNFSDAEWGVMQDSIAESEKVGITPAPKVQRAPAKAKKMRVTKSYWIQS